ncbi:hypothetical protein ACOMHN_008792 [Nucella lapillus]
MAVAHTFAEKVRTSDVLISESVDFAGLLLSKSVLNGLKNAGFERPSPIQLKAIPLGRCGLDLIVQAKSGTGKTCVFSVVALEGIEPTASSIQVLVLAPTREIALQIWEVICSIGSAMSGLCCHTFIGGMPVHEDKKKLQRCHIAVGTPGRIQSLIQQGLLKTKSIRLFVLDEADKLLEEGFQKQINWIYSALPDNKQMLALSATYPEYLAEHLTLYMRNPTFVRLNITDPTLLGIKQYYTLVPSHPLPHREFESKTAAVIRLLSSITFNQCLIFSNWQTRAQNLQNELSSQGWPTSCIAGCLDQKDRITAITQLKSYSCRVLISTDLTSRGIDADKVNLVINLDVPSDHETYLHRIGRAGRFGSYGAGVAIVSDGQELVNLHKIERNIGTHVLPLPDPIPRDLVKLQLPVNYEDVVSTEQIITRSDDLALSTPDRSQTLTPTDLAGHTDTSSSGRDDQGSDLTSSVKEEGDLTVPSEEAVKDSSVPSQLSDRPGLAASGACGTQNGTIIKEAGSELPGIPRVEEKTDLCVPLENGSRETTGVVMGGACDDSSPASWTVTSSEPQKPSGDTASADEGITGACSPSSVVGSLNGDCHVGPEVSAGVAERGEPGYVSSSADTGHTKTKGSPQLVENRDKESYTERSSGTSAPQRDGQENGSALQEFESLKQKPASPSRKLVHTSDFQPASVGITAVNSSADTKDSLTCETKTLESSESALKRGTEAGHGKKKKSKGRATGNLWASMLTDQQDREQKPEPDGDASTLSVSSKKKACAKQTPTERPEEKKLSWEKELELYMAAQSKRSGVLENNSGDEEDSGLRATPNRPVKRAKKRVKPVSSEAHKLQNGQADVTLLKTENEDHQTAPAVAFPHTLFQKEERKDSGRQAAHISKDEAEPPLVEESARQSLQNQRLLGKPYLSSDPKVQSAFLASAEQHGFKEILLNQKTNHVPPPKISTSSEKPAKKSTACVTYASLLQKYNQYLKESKTRPVKSVPILVQQTFRLPPAPEQHQCQNLIQFLGHFYAKWDKASSDVETNGADSGSGKEIRPDMGAGSVDMSQEKGSSEAGFASKGKNKRTENRKGKSDGDDSDVRLKSAVCTATAEPASRAVDTSRRTGDQSQATANGKEETAVKNKRTPRYRPMAVCGLATLHLFQPRDNTQGSVSTSKVPPTEPSSVASSAEPFSEMQDNAGRQAGDLPAGVLSAGKGAIPKQISARPSGEIPASKRDNTRKQFHSKPAGTSVNGKDPFPKQASSGGREAQSSDEDSSSDSSSSSSSSSSTSIAKEVELPKGEYVEENWMCFHNQYAVENSTHRQGKRLGPRAHTGRKGKEKTVKSHVEPSSSQEDRSEKKRHEKRAKSGTSHRAKTSEADWSVPVGQHSSYPYSMENNASNYHPTQSSGQDGVFTQHGYHPPPFTHPSNVFPSFSGYPSGHPQMASQYPHKGQGNRADYLPYSGHGLGQPTAPHWNQYSHAGQTLTSHHPDWNTVYSLWNQQGQGNPYSMPQQSSTHSSSVRHHPASQRNPGFPYSATQPNPGFPYSATQPNPGFPYSATQPNPGFPYSATQPNPGFPYPVSQPNPGFPYPASQQNPWYPHPQSQRMFGNPSLWQGRYQPDPVLFESMAKHSAYHDAMKAVNMNHYIQSMSRFYASFCAHSDDAP